jgi:hypothetical protein
MSAFSMKYCAKDVFKDGKARKLEQVYTGTNIPKKEYAIFI